MKEEIDNYCVDCKGWTRQIYHHTNHVDGDLVYMCKTCGCENSVYPLSEQEFHDVMDQAWDIIK